MDGAVPGAELETRPGLRRLKALPPDFEPGASSKSKRPVPEGTGRFIAEAWGQA